LEDLLQVKGVSWKQIDVIVSDSPNVMIKLGKNISVSYPHIVRIRCCLHEFNLIAKDILKYPQKKGIINGNLKLVNYFTSCGFWNEKILKWQKSRNIQHGLSAFVKTRFYSMKKVCLSVAEFKEGFKYFVQLNMDPGENTPDIPNDKIELINDKDLFTDNCHIIAMLKPVIDAI
jgi:hypothetical protein